jgi:DNA mismatch repair protein MutL
MIRLLPDYIANQIAAGEVVQRPASVVKELLENAIDAGASSVTVMATDAGRTSIQVIDNGKGMNDADARMAFERHATSKIQTIDDLQAINTFGFRGEALASIAAVADVVLTTRCHENEVGTQIQITTGEPAKQSVVAAAAGTAIHVKNLFYNVPARRKFLKSDNIELKHIVNEFSRVALCRPEVEMKLRHNNHELYHLTSGTLRQRIVNMMGKNLNQQLIDVHVETSVVNIHGFIGKPDSLKRNSGNQFFFVNGRYFRSAYFQKAIAIAYDKLLVRSNDVLPTYFIYFEIPPANIDVNIHPAKTEIKFEDEHVIFQMLNAAVRESLSKFAVAPSIDFDTEGAPDIPVLRKGMTMPSAPKIEIDPHFNPFDTQDGDKNTSRETFKSVKNSNAKERQIDANWQRLYDMPKNDNQETDDKYNTSSLADLSKKALTVSFIQLKGKYMLTPVKSGVMVINIRRAQQRIYYEHYISRLANHKHESQQQIFPETIELRPEDYLLLESVFDELHLLGYDISAFGNNTIAVNGLPATLSNIDINEWVDILIQELRNSSVKLKEQRQTTLAASLAKTAAGYSSETLTSDEAQALIDRLFACETPAICPAGKPVIHIISIEEIDKKMLKS